MTLWDGRRVPMTLLGGYLGAGKTTIVNQVLAAAGAEGRRIAVLVNDLGTVQVDAALIAARHDDTIELANGCICCSLVDGLAVALESLRSRPEPPDHVLVELSGVAEPARVVPWASTAGFRLDGVVVAADADQIRERAADPRLAGLVQAQLAAADLVALTKLDLTDDAGLRAWLTTQTDAPVVEVHGGELAPDVLLGPLRRSDRPRHPGQPVPSAAGGRAVHVHQVVAVPRLDPDQLRERLGRFAGLVRAKGTVETTSGPVLVQLVGRRISITPWDDVSTGELTLIALDAGALHRAADELQREPSTRSRGDLAGP